MPTPITITLGPKADPQVVSEFTRTVLKSILRKAGLPSALITSTARTPAQQARVMFDNIQTHGVAHQKALYAAAGDQVIDVFVALEAQGKTPAEIKAGMEQKILEVGPSKVSRHLADPKVLNVVDVAPSSIANKAAFRQAVRDETRVNKFLAPPQDPAYHLEIPQPANG